MRNSLPDKGRSAGFGKLWARGVILVGLWWLALSMLGSARWIRQNFGVITLDQLLFHLQLGWHGLLAADRTVIKSFAVFGLLLPAAAAPVLSLLSLLLKARKKLFFIVPMGCLAVAGILLLDQVSFLAYAESRLGGDYFSAHYQDPQEVTFSARHPRNLVLIYVESLDAGYGDRRLFGKNLLHGLDATALAGLSFARYSQMPGTGWTMAGIVSTQCGVPLEAITLYDGNAQGEKLKRFLPGAVCLGDVLESFGYRNVFLGGASLAFAGKGQFFKDHHYAELFGREEWAAGGETAEGMSGWGLHDDDLFRHAKSELDVLEKAGGRFNLTLLTVDTHYPDSRSLSKTCERRGVRGFEDIVECTADQVGDFVSFIRQRGYLKNVDVVVLGDHLAMTNPVIAQLNKLPERHIFNLFISQDAPRKTREDIVHFDLFPTILDFIGIRVSQSRLALGYSGFSSASPLDENRLSDMRTHLLHPSASYFDLWTPKDQKS